MLSRAENFSARLSFFLKENYQPSCRASIAAGYTPGAAPGRSPDPLLPARGPKGIEKKCAFLQGQNYDTVDKENTISRNAEKTAPVCPCEPLCRTNGGGEASICPQNPASALVGAGWRRTRHLTPALAFLLKWQDDMRFPPTIAPTFTGGFPCFWK